MKLLSIDKTIVDRICSFIQLQFITSDSKLDALCVLKPKRSIPSEKHTTNEELLVWKKLQGYNANHILYIFNGSSLKIQFVAGQSHVSKNFPILSIIFLVQNSIKIKKPEKKDKKKSLSCFSTVIFVSIR